jgi:hypothetical protein
MIYLIKKIIENYQDWRDLKFIQSITTCSCGETINKCSCNMRDTNISMLQDIRRRRI